MPIAKVAASLDAEKKVEAKATEVKAAVAEKKEEVKKVAAPAKKTAAPKKAAAKKVAVPAKKTAAPKKAAEKKVAAPAKKTATPKKAVAKKAAAPAKKTAVSAEVMLQFAEKEYTQESLLKIAKDVWTYDYDKKASELKKVQLFVKPEESKVYYVFNDDITGAFDI